MNLEQWLVAQTQLFALVFFRVLSLCLVAPIFGNKTLSPRIKVGFGLCLAILLMPLMVRTQMPVVRAWAVLPGLILMECSVGFMIGLVASLLFAATHLSGEILGRHMGFGMARVLDPESGKQASVIANFENLLALMLFLAIGGHHLLVMALCDSFEIVPIGGVQCDSGMAMEMVRVVGRIFPIAIKITAPAFAILMVTTVVIGLVARCVPQMNVLIVGMPLRVGVGLIGLAACVPMFSYVFEQMMKTTYGDIYMMLRQMH